MPLLDEDGSVGTITVSVDTENLDGFECECDAVALLPSAVVAGAVAGVVAALASAATRRFIGARMGEDDA